MKTTKIKAESMPLALKKIRNELGENAVILHTKTGYTKGFLGLFKKQQIEVFAAVDTESELQSRQLLQRNVPKQQTNVHTETHHQIEEMKNMLIKMSHENKNSMYPRQIELLVEYMKTMKISDKWIHYFGEKLFNRWKHASKEITITTLLNYLKQDMLIEIKPLYQHVVQSQVIHLIGPTGVGKTTTIAKLAADALLEQYKKVALLTTDTFRIAAIEQLKTYANLLNVDMHTLYSPDDYKIVMNQLQHIDMILVDTSGRNYREKQLALELQQFISNNRGAKTTENLLTLSLTMKEEDMREILNNFNQLFIHAFVFTKQDETTSIGSMFNMMVDFKKPVRYVTNGQEVPDDLVVITPELFIENLFKEISI